MSITRSYYAGLVTLLALIITGTLSWFLSGVVAQKVAENSEGFLLALLLAAWVQFARPRLSGAGAWWAAGAGAAALGLGAWLYGTTAVPGSVKTLNETFLALGLLVPYVQLRRPLPRGARLGLPGAALLLMLFAGQLTLVTRLAETLGMLLLVPLVLDVVDRGVLDPDAVTSARLRHACYATLLLAPLAVSVLNGLDLAGVAGAAAGYVARLQEAWVGVLVLVLHLAVGRQRTGRPAAAPAALAPA